MINNVVVPIVMPRGGGSLDASMGFGLVCFFGLLGLIGIIVQCVKADKWWKGLNPFYSFIEDELPITVMIFGMSYAFDVILAVSLTLIELFAKLYNVIMV